MPCSVRRTSARRFSMAGAIICLRSRITNPHSTSTLPPCSTTRRPFPPYQQKRWESEQDACTTTNKGHGRVETRTLATTPALSKYLSNWPGIAQVFQIQRTRRFPDGRVEQETAYGITSLKPLDAGAARLLELNRTHWSIENNLHWVRDMVFGEDGCRVRRSDSPQLL